jgi:hypothetical protein
MVSHVDHTEHDVDILVTEVGLADLRGLAPRERARVIIDNCVHPDYREALNNYFTAACAIGGHTPHILREALSWHINLEETGRMLKVNRYTTADANTVSSAVAPPLLLKNCTAVPVFSYRTSYKFLPIDQNCTHSVQTGTVAQFPTVQPP